MVNGIINFFLEDLTFDKEARLHYYSILIFTFTEICIGSFGLICFITKKGVPYKVLIVFGVLSIFTLILFKSLKKRVQNIFKKKFDITETSVNKRNERFRQYRKNKLKGYLDRNNIKTCNDLERLIGYIYKEIEKRKITSIIKPGIIIALLIPVWAQFVNILYKPLSTMEDYNIALNYGIKLTLGMALITFLTVYCVSAAKTFMGELLQELIDRDIENIKVLARILEDILLTMESDNNSTEVEQNINLT